MPGTWKIFSKGNKGQAMAEAAVAIPIFLLLVAGSLQCIQVGLAHVMVMEAAYEAARQAHMDRQGLDRAREVARSLCRRISPGATDVILDGDECVVIHRLRGIFPVVKNLSIRHGCPDSVFQTMARERE